MCHQGEAYGISNAAIIGALFIPLGIGNMGESPPLLWNYAASSPTTNPVGAPLAGYLSDKAIVVWRERRGGVWVPEDRLRAAKWGAAFCVPVSTLVAGLTMKYVPGIPGIAIMLVCLFLNGIGVCAALTW